MIKFRRAVTAGGWVGWTVWVLFSWARNSNLGLLIGIAWLGLLVYCDWYQNRRSIRNNPKEQDADEV